MDYCPWTQSMPSRDVNAATRLAEASWRRDNMWYMTCLACRLEDGIIFLAYRIGESVDLPVHGKPYLSPHHSELLECLPTQYTGEEFRLSPQCMDDFRFSDVM